MDYIDNLAYPGEPEYVFSTDYGFIPAQVASGSSFNRQTIDWSPNAVTPGASSWDDVLKYGLSRLIDAKVRPVDPYNAVPVTTPTQAWTPASVPAWVWLAIGGLVLVAAFTRKG